LWEGDYPGLDLWEIWSLGAISFCFALIVCAVLVSATLASSPVIWAQDFAVLPHRIAKPLGMQRVMEPIRRENIPILNDPPKYQAQLVGLIAPDGIRIEHAGKSFKSILLLRSQPKVVMRAVGCFHCWKIKVGGHWLGINGSPKVSSLGTSSVFENGNDFKAAALKWLNVYLLNDHGAELHNFRLVGNPRLNATKNSGETGENQREYRDYYRIIPSLIVIIGSIFGAWTGLQICFNGPKNRWLGYALIVAGWFGVILSVWLVLVIGPGWHFSSSKYINESENASVFCGFFCVSAPRYCGLENVVVHPIVVPELEFRDVQRQIFAADLVEAAHDTAFQERPKAIDRLGVNHAVNILLFGVADEGVREIFLEFPIAGMFVSYDKADIFCNGLPNETIQSRGIGIANDAGDHIALALDRADNDELAGYAGSGLFLVPMPVAVAPANIGFVNLNDAAKLSFRLNESGADFVAHGMRSAVGTEAHDALDLEGADTLFARQHQMHDTKPLPERLIRVLKDGAGDMREAIGGHASAFVAVPVIITAGQSERISAAAWAFDAIGPAARNQVSFAGIFIRERRFELSDGHLMNWFRAAHGVSSQRERNIAWPI
jgi:hypothetical protein